MSNPMFGNNANDGVGLGSILVTEQLGMIKALEKRLAKLVFNAVYHFHPAGVILTPLLRPNAKVMLYSWEFGLDPITWGFEHAEYILSTFYSEIPFEEVVQEHYVYDCPDDGRFVIGFVAFQMSKDEEVNSCPVCGQEGGGPVWIGSSKS